MKEYMFYDAKREYQAGDLASYAKRKEWRSEIVFFNGVEEIVR